MNTLCKIKNVLKQINTFEQLLIDELALSLNEGLILCCLSEHSMRSGKIAEETGISTTRTSRILASLENKGLVIRSIDTIDKRKMIFELSDLGIVKHKAIKELNADFEI